MAAPDDYRIPAGASAVLTSYIRQNMKFFVARVNLDEQAKLGYTMLRPLQVEYVSPKFMLPIRLGTVNADGPQELFVYTLTRKGRVETTNYRTVKLPSGMEVPAIVKDRFADFYRAMFSEQARRHNMSTVFTEYAWDMGWCDSCAADPLSQDELRALGVRDGEGGSVFLTVARALRRRALSGGPGIPGDGGPGATSRDATCSGMGGPATRRARPRCAIEPVSRSDARAKRELWPC